jgi:hypothetical protein
MTAAVNLPRTLFRWHLKDVLCLLLSYKSFIAETASVTLRCVHYRVWEPRGAEVSCRAVVNGQILSCVIFVT